MKSLTFAVLLSLSFIACGGSPPSPLETKNGVFIGDSVTVVLGNQPQFQAHANWTGKGVSGQTSANIAGRFEADVVALHPDIVHILAGTNDVYSWWLSPCSMGPDAPWWVGSGGVANLGIDDCSTFGYMVQTAKANGIQVVVGTIPPWGTASGISSSSPEVCAVVGYSAAYQACLDPSPERYLRIDELNAWLKQFAAEQGITIVDYHSGLTDDGQHYRTGETDDGVHPNAVGSQIMFDMLLSTPLPR